MEAKLLKRTQLKPDENQPRKSFDLDSLIESIKERGVITPLIITEDSVILDGERRWRASEGIQDELPCVIVDRKEYDQPDKRLELQLIIDEMREDYNVIDKAEAYKRYVDAGHSKEELARLLKHKSPTAVKNILSLLNTMLSVQQKLKQDDTNYRYHTEIETKLTSSIPKQQKERIHQRAMEGAFDNFIQLQETLEFAKSHPVHLEEIAEAKDASARTLVMLNAEPIVKDKYKQKKRVEMSQPEIDKERLTQMMQALNSINSCRILWSMTDAIDFVKKTATKEQKEAIVKSVDMIVEVWNKTSKALKKD